MISTLAPSAAGATSDSLAGESQVPLVILAAPLRWEVPGIQGRRAGGFDASGAIRIRPDPSIACEEFQVHHLVAQIGAEWQGLAIACRLDAAGVAERNPGHAIDVVAA